MDIINKKIIDWWLAVSQAVDFSFVKYVDGQTTFYIDGEITKYIDNL